MALWYFWVYSFLGYLLEKAYAALTHGAHQRRRCFLLLPLCPVTAWGCWQCWLWRRYGMTDRG